TNLCVPKFGRVLLRVNKSPSRAISPPRENLCLDDEVCTPNHLFILCDCPVIFTDTAHSRADIDWSRASQQIVGRDQFLKTRQARADRTVGIITAAPPLIFKDHQWLQFSDPLDRGPSIKCRGHFPFVVWIDQTDHSVVYYDAQLWKRSIFHDANFIDVS